MAFGASQNQVLSVMESTDNLPSDISIFILTAHEIVTELCTNSGYTDSRLTLIETWLAAHFCAIRQRSKVAETAGDTSESFEQVSWRDSGAGFATTRYGNSAISLDTDGNLLRASFRQGKGWRKNKSPIYGGSSSDVNAPSPTDYSQPGNFPG